MKKFITLITLTVISQQAFGMSMDYHVEALSRLQRELGRIRTQPQWKKAAELMDRQALAISALRPDYDLSAHVDSLAWREMALQELNDLKAHSYRLSDAVKKYLEIKIKEEMEEIAKLKKLIAEKVAFYERTPISSERQAEIRRYYSFKKPGELEEVIRLAGPAAGML